MGSSASVARALVLLAALCLVSVVHGGVDANGEAQQLHMSCRLAAMKECLLI